MKYTKDDMVYTDYLWKEKNKTRKPIVNITGSDRFELDRRDGYQMLYLIECLAQTWNWHPDVPVEPYQRLERIIRIEVPPQVRSFSGIKNWIMCAYPVAQHGGEKGI